LQWKFEAGAQPVPKLLVFSQSTHLLMNVSQARLAVAAGRELVSPQFNHALARANGSWDAQLAASASQLQALKTHAGYPSTSSKANLAHTYYIQQALGLLYQLPPSLASSFWQQLHIHAPPATQHQHHAQAGPSSANQPPPPNQVNPPPSSSGHAYYARVSKGVM